MNIAWLTPEIPFPPIGGRNGVYNRIVQLSKYNNIFLFSIAYSEEEENLKIEMEKYCTEVHYYNRNSSNLKKILKSLIMPYSVASRTISELRFDLKSTLLANKIDIVIVDFPNMVRNIIGIVDGNYYCTLNQHNMEFQRMREMGKIETIPVYKRIAYYLESFRLELYEKNIYNKNIFHSITFFSKDDMTAFRKKWRNVKSDLKLFPLGANCVKKKYDKVNKHNMLFVGRLDDIAITNVEAAVWFVKGVMPIILKEIPDAHVIIAGANPCQQIMELENEFVEVIPNYKNLEDVYSLSDIVILPVLSGGGVKGKLLEAVAFNKLVISTSRGIEGTEFEDGKHVLLADTKDQFAEKCKNALKDICCYQNLIESASKLFADHYDWESIGRNYNNYLTNNKKELKK